ncbi:MAG: hypothetical protein NVV68_14865 [Dokdonella sp.]|nr:hypothetical protein [Dokdonella sp.]
MQELRAPVGDAAGSRSRISERAIAAAAGRRRRVKNGVATPRWLVLPRRSGCNGAQRGRAPLAPMPGESFSMRLHAALCALFLSAGSAVADTAPPSIPVADFVKRAEVQDIQLSPTGQYLAMTVPVEDGTTILIVIDRESMKPTGSIRAGGSNVIGGFWWANDTRVIATVAQKFGGRDKPIPTGELFAIDADGKNSKQIFGYRSVGEEVGSRIRKGGDQRYASAYVLNHTPDKDKRILVEVHEWKDGEPAVPTLEQLDIYTGTSKIVGKGPAPAASLILDGANELRAAVATGKQNNLVFYGRAGKGTDWTVFNDSGVTGVVINPLRFTRDNRHLYAEVSEPGQPYGLYKIDMESREKTLVYRGKADPGALLETADGKDRLCGGHARRQDRRGGLRCADARRQDDACAGGELSGADGAVHQLHARRSLRPRRSRQRPQSRRFLFLRSREQEGRLPGQPPPLDRTRGDGRGPADCVEGARRRRAQRLSDAAQGRQRQEPAVDRQSARRSARHP